MRKEHVAKIDREISELHEMKKLRHKHFLAKDRKYLFGKLDSFSKKIERTLQIDLGKEAKSARKARRIKMKLERTLSVANDLSLEMDQKIKIMNKHKKFIESYKKILSRKKSAIEKKIKEEKAILIAKKKNISSIKKLKKKI